MILVKFQDGKESMYPKDMIEVIARWGDIDYIIDFDTGEVLLA